MENARMEIREPYNEMVRGGEPFCVYTPATKSEPRPSIAVKMRFTGENDAALAGHELEVFVGVKAEKGDKDKVTKITSSWWRWRAKPMKTDSLGCVSFSHKFSGDPTKHYFLVQIAGVMFRIGVMEAGQSITVLTSIMPAVSDEPSHRLTLPPPIGPGRTERKNTKGYEIFPPEEEQSSPAVPMQVIDQGGRPKLVRPEEPDLPALPNPRQKQRHTTTLKNVPAVPSTQERQERKSPSPEEFDRRQQKLEAVIVKLLAELKQAGGEAEELSRRFGQLEREYIEATSAFLDQAVLSTETVVEFEDAGLRHLAEARALLEDTKNTASDTAEQTKREIAAMIEVFHQDVSAHRLARLARLAKPIIGHFGLNESASAMFIAGIVSVGALVWFVWTILPK